MGNYMLKYVFRQSVQTVRKIHWKFGQPDSGILKNHKQQEFRIARKNAFINLT